MTSTGKAAKLYVCFIVFWIVARFCFLELSPPGFYVDESGGATNILCLSQIGETFGRDPYPLFPMGPSGGRYTPTYTYFAVGWTRLFGDSIASFRAISALFHGLAVVGLFFLARLFLGTQFALLATLSAAMMPWAFHFSRIAWDPPLMNCFLIWGYYFLLRSRRVLDTAFAGVMLGLGGYAYSAGRIQLVVMVPLIFLLPLIIRPFDWKRLFILSVSGIITCLPLMLFTISAAGQARFQQVSILAPDYFRKELHSSFPGLLWAFVKNFSKHLSPEFLFITGDSNGRHNPADLAQLGALEALALLFLIPLAIAFLLRRSRGSVNLSGSARLILFSVVGVVAGIMPAALTWDSLPHSLRSIAAWPFLALLSGWCLWAASQRWNRAAPALILLTSFLYSGYQIQTYFFENPKTAYDWFDTTVKEEAIAMNTDSAWKALVNRFDYYDESGLAYYLMHYGKMSCSDARDFIVETKRGASVKQALRPRSQPGSRLIPSTPN